MRICTPDVTLTAQLQRTTFRPLPAALTDAIARLNDLIDGLVADGYTRLQAEESYLVRIEREHVEKQRIAYNSTLTQ